MPELLGSDPQSLSAPAPLTTEGTQGSGREATHKAQGQGGVWGEEPQGWDLGTGPKTLHHEGEGSPARKQRWDP